MNRNWKALEIYVGLVALVVLLGFLGIGLFGWELLLGWTAYAFFHYRYVRQEELLHVLTTAKAAGLPLGPALRAYVEDRPRSRMREFWVGLLLFFVLPGYYWFWHRRHSYDRKVEEVADLLFDGADLYEALQAVPGVASREMVLAAAIGQSTGKLPQCLQSVPRWRLATVWLEVLPRLLYPLIMLLIINTVLLFLLVFIVPKYESIFADLKVELPWLTIELIEFSRRFFFSGWGGALLLGILMVPAIFLVSSTACWYFPVVARIYRMHAQSRLLKMLAILLDTGKPVPEALAILENSGYFAGVVQRRLTKTRYHVEQGEPLPQNLYRQGLLPGSMVALVGTAERAQNLPWALAELGEYLARRSVQLMQRITMSIFPVTVVAIGVLVGFVVLSMFLPLLELMSGISV